MASFKLLNYAGVAGEARSGILVGDNVIDLASAGMPGSTYELLQNWDANQAKMAKIADDAASHKAHPLADAQLMAPVVPPVDDADQLDAFHPPPAPPALPPLASTISRISSGEAWPQAASSPPGHLPHTSSLVSTWNPPPTSYSNRSW